MTEGDVGGAPAPSKLDRAGTEPEEKTSRRGATVLIKLSIADHRNALLVPVSYEVADSTF